MSDLIRGVDAIVMMRKAGMHIPKSKETRYALLLKGLPIIEGDASESRGGMPAIKTSLSAVKELIDRHKPITQKPQTQPATAGNDLAEGAVVAQDLLAILKEVSRILANIEVRQRDTVTAIDRCQQTFQAVGSRQIDELRKLAELWGGGRS
jgi:hypothetical protein